MAIEEIGKALDANQNLTDEVRDNLYGLSNLLHEKLPNVDLTNLINCLSNVQIKYSKKFINKRVSKYDSIKNVIELNKDELMNMSEDDVKHIMMSNILHMATNNGKMTGFDNNGEFRALNEGYTEIYSNYLVGTIELPYLEQEFVEANVVAITLSEYGDTFEEAYFNNNPDLLRERMTLEGYNVGEFNDKVNAIYDQEDRELKREASIKLNPEQDCINRAKTDVQKMRVEQFASMSPNISDPIITKYIVFDKKKNMEMVDLYMSDEYIGDLGQVKVK